MIDRVPVSSILLDENMIYTLTLNPALDKTITVDEFIFDGVNRPTGIQYDSGGKGFNVSRALMRLGVENHALGFVGGQAGEWLEHDLADEGIHSHLIPIQQESRTNLVIRERSGRYLKINENGPAIGASEIDALFSVVDGYARKGDWWALCGSIPCGLPEDIYQQLIKTLHKKGAKVALDASGQPLKHGCSAQPELVKPNQYEAWELIGNQTPVAHIPDWFHARGIQTVALSLGEEGCIYSEENKWVWVLPPEITPQNLVGAGDALLAGALFAKAHGMSLTETAKWATAAGTAAAQSITNCFPSFESVETIYNQLKVKNE